MTFTRIYRFTAFADNFHALNQVLISRFAQLASNDILRDTRDYFQRCSLTESDQTTMVPTREWRSVTHQS